MNKLAMIKTLLLAFILNFQTLALAQNSCIDIFSTGSEIPQVKALLPGADFVLSEKFQSHRNRAMYDERFLKFLKKYPFMDIDDAVALRYYTGSLASRVNKALGEQKYVPEFRQAQVYINSALKHLHLSTKSVLYRGLWLAEIEKLEKYSIGEEFILEEFKSTTEDIRVAENFSFSRNGNLHIMEIKNAKAYDLQDVSLHAHEKEYLIKSGSRFKLVDVKSESRMKIFVVEMLE